MTKGLNASEETAPISTLGDQTKDGSASEKQQQQQQKDDSAKRSWQYTRKSALDFTEEMVSFEDKEMFYFNKFLLFEPVVNVIYFYIRTLSFLKRWKNLKEEPKKVSIKKDKRTSGTSSVKSWADPRCTVRSATSSSAMRVSARAEFGHRLKMIWSEALSMKMAPKTGPKLPPNCLDVSRNSAVSAGWTIWIRVSWKRSGPFRKTLKLSLFIESVKGAGPRWSEKLKAAPPINSKIGTTRTWRNAYTLPSSRSYLKSTSRAWLRARRLSNLKRLAPPTTSRSGLLWNRRETTS